MFAIRMTTKPAFRVIVSPELNPHELKFAIRNAARENGLYFTPIPEQITVNSEQGKIEINILGRWLFGTPGFAGHYRQYNIDRQVIINLPDYEPAPKLVESALETLKTQGVVEKVEKLKGQV